MLLSFFSHSSLSRLTKAGEITHLCLDVDGVLTDGRLYYSASGEEAIKAFHVRDGRAIKSWLELGLKVLVISGRSAPQVKVRMKELGVEAVFTGVDDKLAVASRYCQSQDVALSELAHIGDDLPDVELMRAVGLGLSVADAEPCVRTAADWVSKAKGGEGAVAEAITALLQARSQAG